MWRHFVQPIYNELTLLPQLFGPVHFQSRSVWLVIIITMLHRISVFIANSVDPDQTPPG